jgi:hypothetical protein
MPGYAWTINEITAHLDKHGMTVILDKEGRPQLLPNGAQPWAIKQLTPHLKARREEILSILTATKAKADTRKGAVENFRQRAQGKVAYVLVGPLACRLWQRNPAHPILTGDTIAELAAGIIPGWVRFVCVEGDKEWTSLPESA